MQDYIIEVKRCQELLSAKVHVALMFNIAFISSFFVGGLGVKIFGLSVKDSNFSIVHFSVSCLTAQRCPLIRWKFSGAIKQFQLYGLPIVTVDSFIFDC